MCFGGKSQETPQLPPTPAPRPIPTPTQVSTEKTEQERSRKISNLKKGVMSTIKTSPAGVTGAGSDLTQSQGNKTLGGA